MGENESDAEENDGLVKESRGRPRRSSLFSEHMDEEDTRWQNDSYGFLTFSIIRFCANHDIDNQFKEASTYAFAIVLYVMVLGTQFVVTGFLMLSGSQMEEKMEKYYFEKHYGVDVNQASAQLVQAAADQEALATKVLSDMNCETGAGDHYLCSCHEQLQVQLPVFYHIMITIWTVRMLNEVKASFWSVFYIVGTSHPEEEGKRVEVQRSKNDPSQIEIVTHLSTGLKTFILFVDPFMRLVVAFALTFAGAKFLLLQTDQSKLVMKVLTMQFVVQVDDYLFGSLVTKKASDEVKRAKLRTDFGSPKRNTWWENGVGSSVYLVLSLVFVWYFESVLFHDISNFRASCRTYRNAMQNSKFGLGNRTSISAMVVEILN